jgi:hypothetical protein
MDSKKSNLTDILSITPNRFALAEGDLPKFVKGQFKSAIRGGLAGYVIDSVCTLAGYETHGFFTFTGAITDMFQYTMRGINLNAMKRENPNDYATHKAKSENLRLFK